MKAALTILLLIAAHCAAVSSDFSSVIGSHHNQAERTR